MSRLSTTDKPGTAVQLSPVRNALKALDTSGALGRAVPTGLSPQRFLRIVETELSKTPKLETCQPKTVLGAVMTAAQLGLEFGPLGHAYLVPYGDKCQLIIGYKGMLDLARRTGQLKSIVARPVHEHDEFDYSYGSEEWVRHRPALGERGKVIAYYGVAQLADGGQVIHVMSRADVEQYRKRSATQKSEPSGPWTTDYDAMACKTVIRRMWPWLPSTVEAAQAIEADEHVVSWTGTTVELDDDVIDAEVIEDAPVEDPPAEVA